MALKDLASKMFAIVKPVNNVVKSVIQVALSLLNGPAVNNRVSSSFF